MWAPSEPLSLTSTTISRLCSANPISGRQTKKKKKTTCLPGGQEVWGWD